MCSLSVKMEHQFYISKKKNNNNFENLKKLQSIVHIFVFFIKISCQSKESK